MDANDGERGLLRRLGAGPVSGDALAREAGLTRAAMWKRIQALRAAGVEVRAERGRGYALAHPLELLDAEWILRELPGPVRSGVAALEVAWSPDSTNSELLRRETPAGGAAVLLAERQTGGRGRRGRTWVSPLAAHLYLSVARQFRGGLARLGGLSIVAGIAAAEALHGLGLPQVRLKWPNDLVAGDRKLGGLLVEGGGEHGGPVRAVVGLGINVRMPAASAAGIDQPWTDLAALARDAGAATVSRHALAVHCLARLLPALDRFDRDGLASFLPRYRALDALAGRRVVVHAAHGERAGTAAGLAADGALRLRTPEGEQLCHAGEVSVRPA